MKPSPWIVDRATGVNFALAGLLLVVAYHSALKVTGSFTQENIETDKAKRVAAQALRENENAMLLLSTGRSYSNFVIYLGFDQALHRRTLLCDGEAILAEGRDTIVFIDKRLSTWLTNTYGEANCNAELMALSQSRGDTVLIDNERIFLSVPAESR